MSSKGDCHGCEGIQVLTPQPIFNRASLDQVRYRVGTQASFVETMLARISEILRDPSSAGSSADPARALQRLTTRDVDDPSIALLDAWASVASVLSFYQERIANEAFLRTATERRSVEELARLVGYQLRPGLASSVLLSFEVDDQSDDVIIPKGTPLKSTPKPGTSAQPQTFETSEEFIAHPRWNVIRPRLTRPMRSLLSRSQLYFKGVGLQIAPNDLLAISDNSTDIPEPLFVLSVREIPDIENPTTIVTVLTDLLVDQIVSIVDDFLKQKSTTDLFTTVYIKKLETRFQDLFIDARLALRDQRLAGADAYFEREFVSKILIPESPSPDNSIPKDLDEMVSWYSGAEENLFGFQSPTYEALREGYRVQHVTAFNTLTSWQAVVNGLATPVPSSHGDWALRVAETWQDLWSHTDLKDGETQPPIYLGLNPKTTVTAATDSLAPAPSVILSVVPDITHVSIIGDATGGVIPKFVTDKSVAAATMATDIENAIKAVERDAVAPTYDYVFLRVIGKKMGEPDKLLAVGIQPIRDDDATGPPTDFKDLEYDKAVVAIDGEPDPIKLFDADFILSSMPSPTTLYDVTAEFLPGLGTGTIQKDGAAWLGEPGTAAALPDELKKLVLIPTDSPENRIVVRFTFTRASDGVAVAFALRTVFFGNPNGARRVRSHVGKLIGEISRHEPTLDPITDYSDDLADVATQLQTLIDGIHGTDNKRRFKDVVEKSQGITITENIREELLAAKDGAYRTQLFLAWDKFIDDADTMVSHIHAKETAATRESIKTKLDRSTVPIDDPLVNLAEALDQRLVDPSAADGVHELLANGIARYGGVANSANGIVNILAKQIMDELYKKRNEFITELNEVPSNRIGEFGIPPAGSEAEELKGHIEIEFQDTPDTTAKAEVIELKRLIDDAAQPITAVGISETNTAIVDLINRFLDHIKEIQPLLSLVTAKRTEIASAVIGSWQKTIAKNRGQEVAQGGTATNPEDLVQSIVDAVRASGQLNFRNLQNLFLQGSNLWPQINATLRPEEKKRIYEQMRRFRNRVVDSPVAYIYRATPNLYGWNTPGIQQVVPTNGNNTSAGTRTVPDRVDPNLYTPTDLATPDENHELRHRAFLDGDFNKTRAGTFIALQKAPAGAPRNFRIFEAKSFPRTLYGLSGNTTRVVIDPGRHPIGWWNPPPPPAGTETFSVLRQARVWCDAERLELAEILLPEEPGNERLLGLVDLIILDEVYPELTTQSVLVVEGAPFVEEIDQPGDVLERELVEVVGLEHKVEPTLYGDRFVTQITLARRLQYTYWRSTVRIYANIVEATHGESFDQVLGDGNGSRRFQRFSLNNSPLTRLPAPTQRGSEEQLVVRVNDVQWGQVERLSAAEPQQPAYEVGADRQQNPEVQFGDGDRGARLPSGSGNVRSRYRIGLGVEGNVDADLIDQMAAPPLGAQSVRNPLRASGGTDQDSLEQARLRAGRASMSLDKLVSLADYRNFALFFAGIDKVEARREDGKVHLTVASTASEPLLDSSQLLRNLRKALRDHGDPTVVVAVAPHQPLLLFIAANVAIDPRYEWETVQGEIRARLLDRFSYRRSEFGGDILAADVQSTIQRVEGVRFVDLDKLESLGQDSGSGTISDDESRPVHPRLPVSPDELCFLDPDVPDMLILEQTS